MGSGALRGAGEHDVARLRRRLRALHGHRRRPDEPDGLH